MKPVFIGSLSTVGKEEYALLTSSTPNFYSTNTVNRVGRSLGKVSPKGLYTGPYFAPSLISNYSAMVGDTVHLSCMVFQVKRMLPQVKVNMNPIQLNKTNSLQTAITKRI